MAVRKQYRTMQGRIIDMDKLRSSNELQPAIGNMKVNARGDEIGTGGKILRTREQIMAQYYENNPNAAPDPDNVRIAEETKQASVPPMETLKVEDTPVSEVVTEKEPEVKKEEVTQEEKVLDTATEAVQRARRRRSGIKDATGE